MLSNLKSLKLPGAHKCLKIPVTVKGLDLRSRDKRPQLVKVHQSDRVQWRDIATEINGRITTGVVINKTHKSLTSFLENCTGVIQCQINNCMKNSMPNIKVNLVFCGLGGNAELLE